MRSRDHFAAHGQTVGECMSIKRAENNGKSISSSNDKAICSFITYVTGTDNGCASKSPTR